MKLEDLFVSPEYRGSGIGKAFFAELAKVAEDKVSLDQKCAMCILYLFFSRVVHALIGPC